MLKYKVIRSFVAVWCAVCLAYAGARTALGALLSESDTESVPAEEVSTEVAESETKPEPEAKTSVEPETEATSGPGAEVYTEPESEEAATIDEGWTQQTEDVEEGQESYTPSLYEYLSQFTCGSCRRNCSLSNPRCHNGSMLAEIKTQEYYSVYGQ